MGSAKNRFNLLYYIIGDCNSPQDEEIYTTQFQITICEISFFNFLVTFLFVSLIGKLHQPVALVQSGKEQ